MKRSTRQGNAWILALALAGVLTTASDTWFAAAFQTNLPMPRPSDPAAPTSGPAAASTMAPGLAKPISKEEIDADVDPLDAAIKADWSKVQLPATTTGTIENPDIPPDAAAVFAAMDERFADSRARRVDLLGRLQMISAVRGYRNIFHLNLQAKWPNLLNAIAVTKLETNDPATTTTWSGGEGHWGLLSDGTTLLSKKVFTVKQDAPATLDEMIAEQIDIDGWGDVPIVTCFLRSKPSQAFKARLRQARVLERDEDVIRMRLISAPNIYLEQRAQIPLAMGIVQHLTIDARQMTPHQFYVDMTEMSRAIYRARRGEDVAVTTATFEVIVRSVELNADFPSTDTFVLPPEPPAPGTSPTLPLAPMPRSTTAPATQPAPSPAAAPTAPPAPSPAAAPSIGLSTSRREELKAPRRGGGTY